VSERVSVELVELSRTFEGVAAVSEVSLRVLEGEFFSLIGPSGCGKTTTLRMIAGLEVPTSGRVHVHGRDVTGDPPYRRPVNTVFQNYALFPHLTVFENIAFGLRERRVSRRDAAAKVREMLELVDLSAREQARPRELSGGQQQRVALARALVLEPEVLLLDEPLGALDLKLRRQMQGLLKDIQREVGITFIYVTHDQEEAFSMSDRVAVMHAGVLEHVGAPQDVYQRPSTAFVADFVGASNRLEGIVVRPSGERGVYAVAVPSTDETFEIRGAPDLPAGAPVWVVIRPEAAALDDPAVTGLGCRAEVADVSFLGPQTIYRLRSEALGEVTVNAKTHEARHAVGSPVQVAWPVESLWAVPQAGSAGPPPEPAGPAGESGGRPASLSRS